MRLLHVEHPDGGGPGVFGDVAAFEHWAAWESSPPDEDFDALVLYGAATNIGDPEPWLDAELEWLRGHLAAGTPMLGLCFGAQVIAAASGAPVVRASVPEIGWHPVSLTDAGRADPVLSAMGDEFPACQWHSYTFGLPEGGTLLASSDVCAQAFRLGRAWGVQFHPEVDRPTYERWIDGYDKDPDAVAQGFDPVAAHAALDVQMPAWNDRGRALFRAFLAQL